MAGKAPNEGVGDHEPSLETAGVVRVAIIRNPSFDAQGKEDVVAVPAPVSGVDDLVYIDNGRGEKVPVPKAFDENPFDYLAEQAARGQESVLEYLAYMTSEPGAIEIVDMHVGNPFLNSEEGRAVLENFSFAPLFGGKLPNSPEFVAARVAGSVDVTVEPDEDGSAK